MSERKLPALLLVVALLVVSVGGFIWLGILRHSLENVIGDEGTFMAMVESVAEDGDLRFDGRDEERIRQKPKGGRWVLILQRTASGVAYSKPIPFAILAAPFRKVFGEIGLVLFNGCALALALLLAFAHARRLGPPDRAALTVATFAGAGCAMGYVAWRVSDSLQLSVSLAGLILALGPLRPSGRGTEGRLGRFLESWLAVGLGAVLLGVVAAMRYPNALLGAGAVAAFLLHRQWRRGLVVLALFVMSLLGISAVTWLATGAAVPYKAMRTSFNVETGYPVSGEAEESRYFEARPATQTMGVKPVFEPGVSAYSALYFLAGRHTGLLLYFPLALVLVATVLRHPDRRSLIVLAAGFGMMAFYLIWMPRNYFGGEGFLGNRYFLSTYAACFVALPRLPRRRWLGLAWALAAAGFFSAVLSVTTTRERDQTSQNHAYAGVFRLLPYESTASAIDGRRDRYWADEFQRFADPFAEVGRLDFHLRSQDPPAEIEVANEREAGVMRFLVNADVEHVILEYRDWRGRQSFDLQAEDPEGVTRGEVEILPAPSWRRHAFWFKRDQPFQVRSFRLALRSPDGEPAAAEIHYLGRYHRPFRIYDAAVLELDLPAMAVAGTRTDSIVRIRNESRQPWNSDRVLPVYLSYELVPPEGTPRRLGRRFRLVEPVKPGEECSVTMTIEWPNEPGTFELVVDLRVEGLGWFREHSGKPLARGVVTVQPPGADDPPDAFVGDSTSG